MTRSARVNFVRQQGVRDDDAASCELRYPALMFQPRLVAVVVLVGVVLQSRWLFAGLGGVLLWSALLPGRNPFDALYNRLVADGVSRPGLRPAPPPRRFAQGMAGALSLGAALALLDGRAGLAATLEGVLVAAVAALVFGRFCLGSFLYHHLAGDGAFARRTLPWADGE